MNDDGFDDRLVGLGGRRAAAHRRPQPGQELVHAERLGHVVVGAGVERLDLVRRVGARRQHDHRRRQPAAQPVEHLDAGHVGQAEVEDDHVGPVLGGGAQRLRRRSPR